MDFGGAGDVGGGDGNTGGDAKKDVGGVTCCEGKAVGCG